ncbi:peptidoglycan DD-metalloendopeptidase family protein [Paenibacillus alginolyticus]|uniref:Peptidoglycan DD-metalloendopeptidase family protein n=1 Tax=Paenibacillus alginolyticus TaxID=59839 RepID=A0ABT4G890_9BACL|nr:peptidoglycan DD-metalloendopeptidase family protein [Paenibacillus alginolyticus]MCY9665064.1 peptidoglycan DD-metalloendopeptidase family protein [Paenibacillus alginolyticus]MCY9692402.1 peptidoglycan DD-metalloendopeptidase family protein [Paenibacillus alginolyticus]MEC0143625.1 peptidoglycan DD-metalloendopeptidase family protein [Paenibacillus alginolyticus]
MKKKILPVVLTLGIAASLAVPCAGYAASTTEKIDQQLTQLKKMKAQAQQKANDAQNQITKVQTEKDQATKDMNTLVNQVNEASKKLTKLNEEIDQVSTALADNAKQLDEAVARVETRDNMLKSRVRLMYMNGFVSYMDVVLSATSFSDFLNRIEALKSIVNQDKEILVANKKDKETVAQKKADTEQQLEKVKTLYADADALRDDLQAKEKAKEVKIASLTKQEKVLEDISEESDKQITQLAKQEADLQAKKRAASNAKSPFTYSGGKLGYPLAVQAPLTSDFTNRINPVTGRSESHKGIDLGAPKGTDILAAENGSVIYASWMNGYGNCVIVDHGNGLWTVYGHIMNDGIYVKVGDVVKRGQKIAGVGSTGQSTGNHLHFEVRKNEVPTDPKPFLR